MDAAARDHDHRHVPQGRHRRASRSASAEVTINGIAKGAGMIAPDMATMLAFVFTDAPIAAPALQALLAEGGRALVQRDHRRQRHLDLRHAAGVRHRRGRGARRAGDRRRRRSAARRVPSRARQTAAQPRPAGGARRRGRAQVRRGQGRGRGDAASAAKRIALSIANSPLVKTAIAGEDANWGRVVMAVGKAGEKAERDKLDIFFGDIRVAHQALRDPAYDEAAVSAYMKKQKIVISVELGIGTARGDRVDLRPHQGICRHQRRLSLVKLLLVVAAALVDADDRVLIAQRPEGQGAGGLVGVSRRQGRRRRAAGRRADPRTCARSSASRSRPPASRR